MSFGTDIAINTEHKRFFGVISFEFGTYFDNGILGKINSAVFTSRILIELIIDSHKQFATTTDHYYIKGGKKRGRKTTMEA